VAQEGYRSCSGCGRLFKRGDSFEDRFFIAHDCDVDDKTFEHDYAVAHKAWIEANQ
jgi:hypothetical protein